MLHARVAARIFFAVLAAICVPLHGATLTVTSTGDAGPGTLRDTLAGAAVGDTITFSVTGTIALASPLPITQSVTINGPGATSLTLDGQTSVAVMTVSAGTLTLSDVTITHGMTSGSGGGIGITGTGAATVSRSIFTANKASNGGAISAAAGTTLTVDECTFSANTSTGVGGGALVNFGTASLSNSTFLGNTGPVNGGAINTQPAGVTTVINSTFVGNTSGGLGGAASNLGTTSLFDSTFSANTGSSGGVLATGNTNLTIDNNVLADNVPDAFSPATGTSGSNNVFYNNSATLDPTGYGTTNFVVAPTEPLGTLGNNGGPTQTQLPSGAALCAGAVGLLPVGLVRDQRGSPRLGACLDAGAVEVSVPVKFVVSAPATATAGVAFNFTVTAEDASNNPVSGYSGTAHFASTDGAAVLPADATLTNGTGTFSATLKTAGSQTITATDTVTASLTGTSGPIAVSASTTSTHFVVAAPSTATAGTAFNFTVTAQDAFNNTFAGYSGIAHFTSTDAGAVLPANATLTNGTGTFSATLNTAGSQTITATDTVTASITGTSNGVGVSQQATTITLSASPSAVLVGQSTVLTVTVIGGPATGTVTFSDSGTMLACSPVTLIVGAASSTASCTATFATPGTHSITAVYSGDASFAAASSPIAAVTVILPSPAMPAPMLNPWLTLLLCGMFGAIACVRLRLEGGRGTE